MAKVAKVSFEKPGLAKVHVARSRDICRYTIHVPGNEKPGPSYIPVPPPVKYSYGSVPAVSRIPARALARSCPEYIL